MKFPVFRQLSARRTALLLFFAFLVFYYLNFKPIIQVDVIAAPYVAWSLVRHASFDTRDYADVQSHVHAILMYTMPDGGRISLFPPGSAVSAIPIVAPFALFREEPFGFKGMMALGKLAAALYAAGTVAITYLLARKIAPRGALPATILLGVGTVLYSTASQSLWMHAPATFFLTLAMYLLHRVLMEKADASPAPLMFLAGLAMGMAFVTRPTLLLFAGAAIFALLLLRRFKLTFFFAFAFAIPASLFLFYNEIHFNHPLSGGYGAGTDTYVWSTPLLHGLAGLTVSPNRGLLVYTPAFVLVPFGLYLLLRRNDYPFTTRILLSAFAIASLATLLTYSKWWAWYGGWCYGPRYLCEICPTLALLLAIALTHMMTRPLRVLATVLITLSIVVHLLGVFGDTNQWSRRHNVGATTPQANASMDAAMFDYRDSQIVTNLRHLLRMD